MSAFDPTQFLDATIDEVLVKLPPLPVGDYNAVIADITAGTWQKKDDSSKSGSKFDVKFTIDVPVEVQTSLGYPSTITMSDTIMLDVTPSGTLDLAAGKNGSLRRYREATGMNVPGVSFAVRHMIGQVVMVKIKHDIWDGEPISRIGGVAKVG